MLQRGALISWPASAKIFILLGVFLISMVMFSLLGDVIARTVTGVGATPMSEMLEAEPTEIPSAHLSYLRLSQVIGTIGLFLVTALLFVYLNANNTGQYLKLTRPPKIFPILLMVFGFLGLVSALSVLQIWMEGLSFPEGMKALENKAREMQEQASRNQALLSSGTTTGALVINLLVMAVTPAVIEEIFFRGTLQQVLVKWWKRPFWAILVTSFVFALVHFQLFNLPILTILGFLLGLVFYWSKNLWYPIMLHFFNNGMLVVILWLEARGDLDRGTSEEVNINTLGVVISCLFGLAFIYFFYRKTTDNEKLG